MNFQKLFKDADAFCGLSDPVPIVQETTNIGPIPGGDKIETVQSDSKHLRSLVRRIPVQPRKSNGGHGKYSYSEIHKKDNFDDTLPILSVPQINWEKEVELLMMESSDEESKPKNNQPATSLTYNIQVPRKIDFQIAPYFCFDTDLVDVEEAVDPLDKIFPNQDCGTISNVFNDGTGDPSKAAGTNITSSLKLPANLVHDKKSDEGMMDDVIDVNEELNAYRARLEIERQRKLEKALRIKSVTLGFDASASIYQSIAGKRPLDQVPQHRSAPRTRSLIAALNHCHIASAHKNSKPDLYEVELKYFHRPRMIKELDRPWQISFKNVQKKQRDQTQGLLPPGSTTPSGGPAGKSGGGMESDKQNLSLAHNRTNFILLEYVEEFPPVMLNYGMASAIFNYYRPSAQQYEEEERIKRTKYAPENRKVNAILNAKNRCRLPRHVVLLLQLKQNKKQYETEINMPRLTLGDTKIVPPEEESPFLGNIEEEEILQSVTNNLFCAPIFKHVPHRTDFLLIRTKLQHQVLSFTIREIPHIYLCGQIEPQKIVPRPSLKTVHPVQEKFFTLALARYLQTNFDGASADDIQRTILKYCFREKSTPHKALVRAKLKEILKKVGDELSAADGTVKWYPKDFYAAVADPDEALEMERQFAPENIAKTFSPEDVCLLESSYANEYRLHQQHIVDMEIPKIQQWLHYMDKVKQFKRERIANVQRLVKDYRSYNQTMTASLEKLLSMLQKDVKRLDEKMNIARFIFDRLISAAWNTTETFVKSQLEKDGQGKMLLQGMGDPSGRGEGYAFVRIPKLVIPGTQPTKKQHVQLYDTDRDLRRLTKRDAIRLLVAMGVREAEARNLRRWDRIHMIRDMSTKMEKEGLAKELHKYARGDAFKAGIATAQATQAVEHYHKLCQQIWQRQKAALSVQQIPASASEKAKKLKSKYGDRDDDEEYSSDEEEEEEDSENDMDLTEELERKLEKRADVTEEQRKMTAEALVAEKAKKLEAEESKHLQSIKDIIEGTGGNSSNSNGPAKPPALGSRNPAAMSGGGAALGISTAITPRRKVAVEGESLTQQAYTESPEKAGALQSTGIVGSSATLHSEPSRAVLVAEGFVPPAKVVKKVTKTYKQDGTEVMKVEYLFQEADVSRVQKQSIKLNKERAVRRTVVQGSRKGGEDDEDDDEYVGATMSSMSLNISKMKRVMTENQLTLKASTKASRDTLGDEVGTYKPTKSNKRAGTPVIHHRLPRVALAARFEKELLDLWRTKNAHYFWYPVNPRDVPGYLEKIASPISLSDIREKNALYQYDSATALLSDVMQMANNAHIFNGPSSPITQAGAKLVEKLKANLMHELIHFGEAKDTIGILEGLIRKGHSQRAKAVAGLGESVANERINPYLAETIANRKPQYRTFVAATNPGSASKVPMMSTSMASLPDMHPNMSRSVMTQAQQMPTPQPIKHEGSRVNFNLPSSSGSGDNLHLATASSSTAAIDLLVANSTSTVNFDHLVAEARNKESTNSLVQEQVGQGATAAAEFESSSGEEEVLEEGGVWIDE